jgi:hypothetical protein
MYANAKQPQSQLSKTRSTNRNCETFALEIVRALKH